MATYQRLASAYVAQPKLNGDRVLCSVNNGAVSYANRHGSRYKFSVKSPIGAAAKGVCLFDGEVEGGVYYPFETLVFDGKDLRNECPSVRIAHAKKFCKKAGIPWLFDTPSADWLARGRANLPRWEGVVLKALGSPYLPLASDAMHTSSWLKLKW